MMGISGFRTKKELKAAVGQRASFIETSILGREFKGAGRYVIVGPSPTERKWYATVTVDADSVIQKVE